MVKMGIRAFTINYNTRLKRLRMKEENDLEEHLKTLHQDIANGTESENTLEQIACIEMEKKMEKPLALMVFLRPVIHFSGITSNTL